MGDQTKNTRGQGEGCAGCRMGEELSERRTRKISDRKLMRTEEVKERPLYQGPKEEYNSRILHDQLG